MERQIQPELLFCYSRRKSLMWFSVKKHMPVYKKQDLIFKVSLIICLLQRTYTLYMPHSHLPYHVLWLYRSYCPTLLAFYSSSPLIHFLLPPNSVALREVCCATFCSSGYVRKLPRAGSHNAGPLGAQGMLQCLQEHWKSLFKWLNPIPKAIFFLLWIADTYDTLVACLPFEAVCINPMFSGNMMAFKCFFQDLCLFKAEESYLQWRFKWQCWCTNSKAELDRAEEQILLVQWSDAVPSHWDLFSGYILHNHMWLWDMHLEVLVCIFSLLHAFI